MKQQPKKHGQRWSSEDMKQLKEMAKTRPTGIIAYKLQRTEDAVRGKADQKNITLKPINRSPYNRHKK